ncbi:MAG: transcriptional repressor [Actinomycetota bacterium]|nr:transcriptional repressor [Actinomycetota bacterium]
MRTPTELTALFRANGRNVTPQRQCIFRALQGDDTHPTAEQVHETVRAEMETVSLKTVYQTLHDLADLGEVTMLDVGTGALRVDPNVERPHHHLVCRTCGKVRDVFVDLPVLELPASRSQGYDVERGEVVFRGLCGECRASSRRAPVPTTRASVHQRSEPSAPHHHRRSNAPAQGFQDRGQPQDRVCG